MKKNRSPIKYRSLKPITKEKYKKKTLRLYYQRKEERNELPLLIVKFDGVLGSFIKQNLFCEE
jgi:hypothetical protein